ncbi:MAG: hypothetical protein M3389_13610 [Actinomycetota bacterium]|nr:hypothetical protein [Actinomycetota bacterium]
METAVSATNRAASLRDDLNNAVLDAYRNEGLTFEKDGEEKPSTAKLAEHVRDQMLKAIARNKTEREAKAIELADLAALVFASTPNPSSPDWPEDDSDEAYITEAVWKRVKADVSKAVQTGRKGAVQKLLSANAETSALFVCTTTVGPGSTKAVFLSDDKDMILAGVAMPRTSRLNNLGADVADDFAFMIGMNPKLKKHLVEKMEAGLKAATSTARAKLQLTSGSEDQQ